MWPLPTRGVGPFRQEFYSICSAHGGGRADCNLCQIGTWYNVWIKKFTSLVYEIAPNVWIYFANLKPMRFQNKDE